jgi:thiamine-monophosphate kinase
VIPWRPWISPWVRLARTPRFDGCCRSCPTGDGVLLGPGDDSALVSLPESQVLISTDMMMQGPDFRFDWSRPSDVGFKAIASNAADIAAMGGVVLGFELAVAVPASTPLRMLMGLAEGFAEGIAALTPGAGVFGGDLSRSEVFTIAVTVLGSMQGLAPVVRSGATPGDVLCVAGEVGLSHRGLQALLAAGDDELAVAGLVMSDSCCGTSSATETPDSSGSPGRPGRCHRDDGHLRWPGAGCFPYREGQWCSYGARCERGT